MAEVELRAISKSFGEIRAIQDLSLTIANGDFFVLLGPTGVGKTTTLRLISGLERPDKGSIFIDGLDVTSEIPSMRDVAMVFQQYSLYPHMTVRENLAFPLRSPLLKTPLLKIRQKITEIAEILQITHKLDNRTTELSGGEMQRVAIGRALIRNPSIYLMDEPLSSLDAKLRADLRVELKRIQAQFSSTILYVTHDQIEAMTMANRIGVLEEGRLIQVGSPREIYENPVSLYVGGRLGLPRINAIPATLFPGAPTGATIMGLRPEHIEQGKGKPAKVLRLEHLGDQTQLYLEFEGHKVVTVTDIHSNLQPDDIIQIQPQNPLYFDTNGNRVR